MAWLEGVDPDRSWFDNKLTTNGDLEPRTLSLPKGRPEPVGGRPAAASAA
jgi:hypothetical protein